MNPFIASFALAALIAAAAATEVTSTIGWPGGDRHVSPGGDFYRYANGGWMDQTAIPGDRAGFSTATVLSQAAEAKVRGMLEAAASGASAEPASEVGKLGAYYAAFMDAARVEASGAQPLKPAVQGLRAIASKDALAQSMGEANASFYGSFFQLSVEPDSRDPDRYVLYLEQSGLGLPDRSNYLDGSSAPLRAAYQRYIAELLELSGWSEPQGAAEAVLKIETRIAAASWTAADERDESKIYNPMTPGELTLAAPGFPWATYLAAAGVRPDRIVVVERTAIPAIAQVFATTPLEDLKAWAAFHMADNAAPDLSSAFYEAWFNLHGRALQGAKAEPARWRRALIQVSGGGSKDLETSRGAMGDAVGRMYVTRWFDQRSRTALQVMAVRLKTTMRRRIAASAWMSPDAKLEALRKVDAYRVEVGAPARGDTYDGLMIRRDDLFGDVERATAYAWARERGRLGQRVDRALWAITPQTVNAYNYAPFSEVVFSAALLQPPAFDVREDPALAYGGIGAIIGHELTHSFDDVGRRFDHTGHVRDWWTSSDERRFTGMADRLVELFSSCEALPGLHVDGRLTLGENLADIGGLQLALEAYHASLNGRPAPVKAGLTGDQRFFLGFALVRRDKRRPEAVRADVTSDTHTPDSCRVNEDVRNVDAWYQAFHIRAQDPLYLPPQARTRIW